MDKVAAAHDLSLFVMRFPQVVLDGEEVTACGSITALRSANGESLADCEIRLQHRERGILLEGEATVSIHHTND